MWYAWRYVNGHWVRRRTGHFEKRDAMIVATDWLRQGQVDESEGNVTADWAAMPIADHIAQFAKENRENPKGLTGSHIDRKLFAIEMMAGLGGWSRVRDITLQGAQSVLQAIRERRHIPIIEAMREADRRKAKDVPAAKGKKGKLPAAFVAERRDRSGETAPSTLNLYRAYLKNFTAWLDRFGRIPSDPLKALARFRTQGAERVKRRALKMDECDRLIRAAQAGPKLAGLSGPDRAMLYRFALSTGFRKAECGAVRPCDFSFDGPNPLVRLAGIHTKNHQTVNQPLPRTHVAMFRTWLAGRDRTSPCWPGLGSAAAAKAVKSDLKRAGISARTEDGRVDFHALRHTYITLLALAGVTPQAAQRLARHHSYQLTAQVYTHLGINTTGDALDSVKFSAGVAGTVSSICAIGGGAPSHEVAQGGEKRGSGSETSGEEASGAMRENTEKTSDSEQWDGRDSNPRQGDYEESASDSKSLNGKGPIAQPQDAEQSLCNPRPNGPALCNSDAPAPRRRGDSGELPDLDRALGHIRDLGSMSPSSNA